MRYRNQTQNNFLESLGSLSTVVIQTIDRQHNIDYLEYLCNYCEHMNLNSFWYAKQSPDNKKKMLQIFQLSVNYSKHLQSYYRNNMGKLEQTIAQKRSQYQQKKANIKTHKQHADKLKQKYKIMKMVMMKDKYEDYMYQIKRQKKLLAEQIAKQRRLNQLTQQYYQQPQSNIPYMPPQYYQNQHPIVDPNAHQNYPHQQNMPQNYPNQQNMPQNYPHQPNIPQNYPNQQNMPQNYPHQPNIPQNFPPQQNKRPPTNPQYNNPYSPKIHKPKEQPQNQQDEINEKQSSLSPSEIIPNLQENSRQVNSINKPFDNQNSSSDFMDNLQQKSKFIRTINESKIINQNSIDQKLNNEQQQIYDLDSIQNLGLKATSKNHIKLQKPGSGILKINTNSKIVKKQTKKNSNQVSQSFKDFLSPQDIGSSKPRKNLQIIIHNPPLKKQQKKDDDQFFKEEDLGFSNNAKMKQIKKISPKNNKKNNEDFFDTGDLKVSKPRDFGLKKDKKTDDDGGFFDTKDLGSSKNGNNRNKFNQKAQQNQQDDFFKDQNLGVSNKRMENYKKPELNELQKISEIMESQRIKKQQDQYGDDSFQEIAQQSFCDKAGVKSLFVALKTNQFVPNAKPQKKSIESLSYIGSLKQNTKFNSKKKSDNAQNSLTDSLFDDLIEMPQHSVIARPSKVHMSVRFKPQKQNNIKLIQSVEIDHRKNIKPLQQSDGLGNLELKLQTTDDFKRSNANSLNQSLSKLPILDDIQSRIASKQKISDKKIAKQQDQFQIPNIMQKSVQINQNNKKKVDKEPESEQQMDQQIVQLNDSQIQHRKNDIEYKMLALIRTPLNQLNTQNVQKFDQSIIAQEIKKRFKVQIANIQDWEQIQTAYKKMNKQLEQKLKLKQLNNEKNMQQKKRKLSMDQKIHKNPSSDTDDLNYSTSLAQGKSNILGSLISEDKSKNKSKRKPSYEQKSPSPIQHHTHKSHLKANSQITKQLDNKSQKPKIKIIPPKQQPKAQKQKSNPNKIFQKIEQINYDVDDPINIAIKNNLNLFKNNKQDEQSEW